MRISEVTVAHSDCLSRWILIPVRSNAEELRSASTRSSPLTPAPMPKTWDCVATTRSTSPRLELGDEEIVFVTWDRDLAQAADRVGLGVAGFTATD